MTRSKQIRYCHVNDDCYQLLDSYYQETPITLEEAVSIDFASLSAEGLLIVKAGYVWDGPSGKILGIDFTPDNEYSMRGSLIHDALYEFMRKGKIDTEWRLTADILFKNALIEDGMSTIQARIWFLAVRRFAKDYADPKNAREALVAPLP